MWGQSDAQDTRVHGVSNRLPLPRVCAATAALILMMTGAGASSAPAVLRADSAPSAGEVLQPLPDIEVTADGVTPPDAAEFPGRPLDPAAVAQTLDPLLAGGALGPGRIPARVVDAATGEVIYGSSDRATTPASTTKVVTAVSALEALGPQAVLTTRTVIANPQAETPRVLLVGGGDPSLMTTATRVGGAGSKIRPATLRELARATARALAARAGNAQTGQPTVSPAAVPAATGAPETSSPSPSVTVEEPPTVRVGYDDSLFTGPAMHPSWATTFPAAGVVAPVTALLTDEGRRTPTSVARSADPARAAADQFVTELRRTGIRVTGAVKEITAGAAAEQLAAVRSPTVEVLVERMLTTSDNTYAENLARLAARASGLPASFEGVALRGQSVLAQLRPVPPGNVIVDGSGLSRSDALSPSTLTSLLRAHSQGAVASGLPVAGATGSLRSRFRGASTKAAAGLARLKTGTLTGVAALAGFVSRPDGRLLVVALLDGETGGGIGAGRDALDRAVAALVSCDCAVEPDAAGPSPGS